jgi:hypothetical protein
VQHLALDAVVVPDALDGRVKGLAGLQVQTDDVALGAFVLDRGLAYRSTGFAISLARENRHHARSKRNGSRAHLERDDGVLNVESAVLCKRLGDHE